MSITVEDGNYSQESTEYFWFFLQVIELGENENIFLI